MIAENVNDILSLVKCGKIIAANINVGRFSFKISEREIISPTLVPILLFLLSSF